MYVHKIMIGFKFSACARPGRKKNRIGGGAPGPPGPPESLRGTSPPDRNETRQNDSAVHSQSACMETTATTAGAENTAAESDRTSKLLILLTN